MTLPPYELIETAHDWRVCLKRLRAEPCIAVDLEANSLYAYREVICLLQISIPGHDFIIDTLAGFPLEGMGKLLADPCVEKIFHASDYDLMLLQCHYGWRVRNLFDTMWAARILGYKNMGLAWFLRDFYGIEVSKRHQKANWGERPLPEALLAYAQSDTHYLSLLRADLAAKLEQAGCMEEAREIFANACRNTVPDRDFDPDTFWSIRGTQDLSPRQRAVLKALYVFRDKEARRRNAPPFKVCGNEVLMVLARQQPRDFTQLRRIKGLPKRLSARLSERFLEAIREGRKAAPPSRPPSRPRNAPGISGRYKQLFAWRKAVAGKRGVETDVIITRETMWDIARRNPKTREELAGVPTLGPCRLAMYVQDLLRVLRKHSEAKS